MINWIDVKGVRVNPDHVSFIGPIDIEYYPQTDFTDPITVMSAHFEYGIMGKVWT